MTGTTTFGAVACAALFIAHGKSDGGMLEAPAELVPEPDNPVDPNAIAVHVNGERIGYLPGGIAERMSTRRGGVLPATVQLWAAEQARKLRVIGWVAYGSGQVRWPHTLANPPAITTAQATAERIASTRRMVDDALTSTSKERAQSMREGMVGDYHFLETVEPIKQLKREGRYEEALTLCYGAIAAAERAAEGRSPALFYTEQAAIIHRKLGQRDKEAAVLQRWLRACPPDKRAGSDIQARLDKLLAKPDRTKALDS